MLPMRCRAAWSRCAGALAPLLLLAACADRGEAPASPDAHSGNTLLGSIVLTASLADADGNSAGARAVSDGSGVRVYCRHGSGEIDSTTAEGGHFLIRGVSAGACTLLARSGADGPETERPLEMPDHDHSLAAVLELAPAGDLWLYPNPVGPEGAAIEFEQTAAGAHRVSILDLSGATRWSYRETAAPPGHYHYHWLGTGDEGEALDPGPYWVRAEFDGAVSYRLALWKSDGEPGEDATCGHIHAGGFALVRDGAVLAIQDEDEIDGELAVDEGETLEADFRFLGEDRSLFAVPDTCSSNRLEWEVADTTIARLSLEPGTKWSLRVEGLTPGTTTVRFFVLHEDHAHLGTLPMPIRVE